MEQLHTAYNNLGSWREFHEPSSGIVRIQYDLRRGILMGAVLFILCGLAAFGLGSIPNNTGNDGVRILGVWLLATTGIAVPLFTIFYGLSERRKGDLIQYRVDDDVLEIPRIE